MERGSRENEEKEVVKGSKEDIKGWGKRGGVGGVNW